MEENHGHHFLLMVIEIENVHKKKVKERIKRKRKGQKKIIRNKRNKVGIREHTK